MISELPKFWITSLVRHEKKQFTALEGAFSVFFAAMVACLFSYVIGLMQVPKFDANGLIMGLFIIPAAVLAIAFLLVLGIRIASSFFGGKGTIGEEWRAVAPSLGSFVLVSGIFCTVWFGIYGAVQAAVIGALPADTATATIVLFSKAGTIFPLMGVFLGIFALTAMYLFGAMQGYWLENLKSVENVDMPPKLSKIIWLGIGVAVLAVTIIALIAVGIWISSQMDALLSARG